MIANNVMSYTIGRDGTIYYSNGKGVFAQSSAAAKPERVSARKLVMCIAEVG